jgi:hypothetical protein
MRRHLTLLLLVAIAAAWGGGTRYGPAPWAPDAIRAPSAAAIPFLGGGATPTLAENGRDLPAGPEPDEASRAATRTRPAHSRLARPGLPAREIGYREHALRSALLRAGHASFHTALPPPSNAA